MKSPYFASIARGVAALCLAVPSLCFAAAAHTTEEHAAAPAGVVLFASLDLNVEDLMFSLPVGVRPVSSGVMESLPDGPDDGDVVGSQLPHFLQKFSVGRQEWAPEAPSELGPHSQMTEPEFEDPSMLSMVEASPIGGAAHALRAERFNTDDGVMDDFAICYRLNKLASVQVIPGDPAPVKLPVVNMKNNTGVTVGMVFRLGRKS